MKKYKFATSSILIKLTHDAAIQLKAYRHDKQTNVERGGVILGKLYPQNNTILVTDIIESKSSKNEKLGILLNIEEIQQIINEKWRSSNDEITYLGDWHTHPSNNPKPSLTDHYTFINNFWLLKEFIHRYS